MVKKNKETNKCDTSPRKRIIKKGNHLMDNSLTAAQIEDIRRSYLECGEKDGKDKSDDVINTRVGMYDDERRYGNYVIRRYDKKDVPVIEITDLQGIWCVCIPYDSEVYSLANMLIDSGEETEIADVFITNLRMVTSIPNGFFHQAVMLLSMAYIRPYLLSDGLFVGKDVKQFRRDCKFLKKAFMKWSAERDEFVRRQDEDTNPGHDYWRNRAERILAGNDTETNELISVADENKKVLDFVDSLSDEKKTVGDLSGKE